MKMKNLLTRHQLLGYFFPGFLFLMLIFCSYKDWQLSKMVLYFDGISNYGFLTLIIGIIIILSGFIGLVFDALRNGGLEDFFDEPPKILISLGKNRGILFFLKWAKKLFIKINWDYIKDIKPKDKERLYDRYYTYYVFDINACIGILLIPFFIFIFKYGLLFDEKLHFTYSDRWSTFILLLIVFLILLRDAASLRKEISEITTPKNSEDGKSAT